MGPSCLVNLLSYRRQLTSKCDARAITVPNFPPVDNEIMTRRGKAAYCGRANTNPEALTNASQLYQPFARLVLRVGRQAPPWCRPQSDVPVRR
jgi:hypothetical protein